MNRLLLSGALRSVGSRAALPAQARAFTSVSRTVTQRSPANNAALVAASARRQASTSTDTGVLYSSVFKRNSTYVLYVILGAAFFEAVYGFFGDTVWELNNRGRLYHHIDWSKFESLYVPEDEEEEDEDDE